MKRILRIVLLLFLGFVVLGTFYWLWNKSRPKPLLYEFVEVKTGDIETTSVATGKVSPRDEILLKPQISGIITELRKEAGEYVRTGDVVAVLKVIPEMTQLNAAESRLRVSEINLKQVENVHVRQKQLYEKGVISREEMETSDTEYKRALEEVDNARDNLDIIRDGISKSTAQMSTTQIRSTIDGMILDIPVKVGNSVIQTNNFNEGTTIAQIANMSDMIFIGNVDETEVGRVHAGMPMKLTVGALGSDHFEALLEYISPKGVEENGAILFEIKAAVVIPDSIVIRAGYSANGEIVLERVDDVLYLPESVVEFKNDSTFVYALEDSLSKPQKFDRRVISIGLSNGINVEVKEGVQLGEKIRGSLKGAVVKKESK